MNSIVQQRSVCWYIFQNDCLLLLKKDNSLPDDIASVFLEPHFLRRIPLGCFNNIDFCCAELDPGILIADTFHLLTLRQVLPLLGSEEHKIAIKAYSVINWDRNHQFCSRCAGTTMHHTPNFERRCLSCGLGFFPRISPSIIVLIKRGDHLLMARSPHFLPGVYGLIAGFVDVGESAEEAVHREVQEEVGLQIKNLSYWGSQPWPFPDSLMIAFTADYAGGEIIMDPHEIEAAGWYKYDNLPGLPSVSVSIASRLIDDFVKSLTAPGYN